MRFPFYILCLMILLLTMSASRVAAQLPAEWQAIITATNEPESISQQLAFGADPGASDGFDIAYDIVLPPPPPEQPPIALDAALVIVGPLPRLSRDIKLKADANQWQLSVRSDTAPIRLTWNISGVPSGKCIFLINGGSTIDMRAQNSLVLTQGQHSLTLKVFTCANLAVSKTVSDASPDEEEKITYTVTVQNNGPGAATGVVVTDRLPSGVTYVSSIRSQGSYSSGTGVWNTGSLASGSSAVLTITATVNNGTGGNTIINTASVASLDQSDPDNTNNSGSVAIIPVNNPPTAPVVDMNIDNPATTDDLVINIVIPSIDNDGDDITYSYAWYRNNILQPDLTSNTVPASRTARNDIWKCVVTPNDGTEDGAPGEDSVAIGNKPPVADAGGIYEGEPGVGVIFDGSGSFDLDGDPLIYSWAFGDGSTGSGVAPAHVYSSSGTYEVSLVVNDFEVNSSPSTTTAYIYYQGEVQQAIIELDPGWTLFSLWVQPIDTRIQVVLASILDEMDSIWTYDPVAQEWLRYVVDGSPFMNNLTDITCGIGYWVNMRQAGALIVPGTEPPTSIELQAGMNLVGYNSDVPRLITECIYSINFNAVWTYNSKQAAWERYFPHGPVFMNSLEYMEPGKGYVIEAESAGEITYP